MRLYLCEREGGLTKGALEYLRGWLKEELVLQPCPLKGRGERARPFAEIRVIRPESTDLNPHPLPQEVDFEEERLRRCLCGRGTVYEGLRYARLVRDLIEGGWEEKAVFCTSDYIATRERGEDRFHLRYAVFGFPVVISLPGIVEAPAKDRVHYLTKGLGMEGFCTGDALQGLDDPRMPRILAGLLLQAWFYYQRGYPFCPDPHCSLYNAHWQRELLTSQRDEPYLLCPQHLQILKEAQNGREDPKGV